MKNKNALGHILALLTMSVWGMTFISTKVLLESFQPVEILLFRFIIGYLTLWLLSPKVLKIRNVKQELIYVAAGICGITLYYLLENIALTYTQASNVGVVVSIAPFFTAILVFIIGKTKEKPSKQFFIGCTVALIGICLISFNGTRLQLNPLGDALSVLAALVWAFYSILSKKIGEFGYSTIQSTRRIFMYGIVCMIPAVILMDCHLDLSRFSNPVNLLNIMFLGFVASAVCFVMWNKAVNILGAVTTSVYIYLNPVVSVIGSAIILKEKITLMAAAGSLLILIGLAVSEHKTHSAS